MWECGIFFLPSSSLPAGWLHKHTNQTSPATMDCVWMKNASVPFTYSSRRKIFLQGRPLEMWLSHARPSAATLPTRFSIKQVNNTIPTPINKWLFLNKVLYLEPLTKATHHNLMWSCTGQIYSPSSSSCLYIWAWLGINRGCWNMRSIWAVTIIIIIIVVSLGKHRLRYSTICSGFVRLSRCTFLPPLTISFCHTLISSLHTESKIKPKK